MENVAGQNEPLDKGSDVEKIKIVIDEHIRPFLNRDGGDLQILSYENKILKISYQGACGCCPHAAYGTLMAIQRVLREKFDPEITVEIV